jgi:pyrroline-5-carboxylate reductase
MATTVGVVGTGDAGSALVRGWLRSCAPQVQVFVHEITGTSTADLTEGRAGQSVKELVEDVALREGVPIAASFRELAARCDVILASVETRDALAVLEALRPDLSADKIVLSSAAGIGLDRLRAALGPGPALFRIACNRGVELGEGVVVLSAEPGTPDAVVERTKTLFAGLGVVELLPEDSFDAAAAVAGSSITLLGVALEGVEDGAVKAGLPRQTARAFVRQTALATALLLQSHPGSPADLKDQVASPGGTTIAGLAVLEDLGVRGAFMRAVRHSAERDRHGEDADRSPVVE